MHVLIVTQYFWPENFRINELALELKNRGHQVTVLTGLPNYPEGKLFPGYGWFGRYREDLSGIKVIRVPLVTRGRSRGGRLVINYLSFVFSAGCLAPLFCRDEYDVIFVFEISPVTVGVPAVILKRLKNVPLFFWVLDLWPETLVATDAVRSKWVLKGVESLVRFIYRRCDRILVASKGFEKSIKSHGGDPEKITYFPNWAEEVFESPKNSGKNIPLPSGFRVLFAGNIGVAQDFPTVLSAAEKLRDVPSIQWIILGEGRMRAWAEEEISRRGLRRTVHLLGRFPNEDMPAFFSQADALLATLRDDPVFTLTVPAKIQSYMASGRPILAALDGEGRRVVEDAGAGLVCPPGDPEALARAVMDLYSMDASLREKMGKSGRKYFEINFSRKVLIEKLAVWMGQAVRQHQPHEGKG